MSVHDELLVSANDAEVLSSLAYRRDAAMLEAGAADALAEILTEARLVSPEHLPVDRVAMTSRVIYREEPGGACHPITLVHPKDGDPSVGRISVLSPIGLALLGRKVGSVVPVHLSGREVTLCVLSAWRRK
jgi:regulator of nucleoside diphosphate kinase